MDGLTSTESNNTIRYFHPPPPHGTAIHNAIPIITKHQSSYIPVQPLYSRRPLRAASFQPAKLIASSIVYPYVEVGIESRQKKTKQKTRKNKIETLGNPLDVVRHKCLEFAHNDRLLFFRNTHVQQALEALEKSNLLILLLYIEHGAMVISRDSSRDVGLHAYESDFAVDSDLGEDLRYAGPFRLMNW